MKIEALATRTHWTARILLAALVVVSLSTAAVLLTPSPAQAEGASILRPASPNASEIRSLAFYVLLIVSGIFLVVEGLLIASIVRFRNRPESEVPQTHGNRRLETVWTLIPAILVIVIFALTVNTMQALDLPGGEVQVEVTGHQWWWEVRYPGTEAVVANEIHVPVQRGIGVTLTSADVIHSFWVPQIGGKTDLVPGHTNHTSFLAATPGRYHGECAEFCGLQHAGMRFWRVVYKAADFSAWLNHPAEPAAEPTEPQAVAGKEVFLSMPCGGCHAIRGTEARGNIAPDLTHVGSRLSLAAGTLDNTSENLRRWLRDPQAVKPGNKMPTPQLTNEQLDQLTAYLEGLE